MIRPQDPCLHELRIQWRTEENESSLIAAVTLAEKLEHEHERLRAALLEGMPAEHHHDWVGIVKAQAKGRRVAVVTILICGELLRNRGNLVEKTRNLISETLKGEFEIAA